MFAKENFLQTTVSQEKFSFIVSEITLLSQYEVKCLLFQEDIVKVKSVATPLPTKKS